LKISRKMVSAICCMAVGDYRRCDHHSDTWTVPISPCADLTLYPAASQDRLGRS
jgi:hypothetical protein